MIDMQTLQEDIDSIIDEDEILESGLFHLGENLFAFDVKNVREFLEPGSYTSIPHAPSHVLGLINLRGENIAVLDLAQKMGLPPIKPHDASRIIILEIIRQENISVIGALTDGVVDVTVLEEETMQNFPDLGGNFHQDFIRKVARYNDQAVLVLDIDNVFDTHELGL